MGSGNQPSKGQAMNDRDKWHPASPEDTGFAMGVIAVCVVALVGFLVAVFA